MRTTLDIPDPLFRHLKARAALEGSTLRDLLLGLVERGLAAPPPARAIAAPTELPSVSLGASVPLAADGFSNAALAGLLDE